MLLAHLISGRYSKTGGDEPYSTPAKDQGWLHRFMTMLRRAR